MNQLSILALHNKHIAQSITCKKGDAESHVYLKGIISSDWGVDAAMLRAAFAEANGTPITLHINSPGGDAFEGREMQAVIAGYPGKITAKVEGIAASAATFIAMSCSQVHMLQGSRFMIHNSMSIALGNKARMKEMFDILDGFDIELAAEYARKAKVDAVQIAAWMDAETWFNSDQAREYGFIDAITPNVQNVASDWNLSAYAKPETPDTPPAKELPAALVASVTAPVRMQLAPKPVAIITPEHRDRQLQRIKLVDHITHQ